MKNIANILGRSNLTARERFILLIQSDINKMKTGKELLTPADQAALENAKCETNEEARTWNRLNEGWKYTGRMDIEAELIFKDAQVAYLAAMPISFKLLQYPTDQQEARCIEILKGLKKVSPEEAMEVANKQRKIKLEEGMDFNYAAYQLAFEILSPEDRKALNELYSDVEFDHQYLDQEEVIAHLYNGGKKLSEEAKKKLAAMVAEQSYNTFAQEYQLFHYFACIPLVEVGRHFLEKKGVEIKGKPATKNQGADDEDENTTDAVTKALEAYATAHNTTVRSLIEEGCLSAINEGMLDEYTPLTVSVDAELLKRWLTTKAKAKEMLLGHAQSGELKLLERSSGETRKHKLRSKNLYDTELAVAREVLEKLSLEITQKGELDEKIAFAKFNNSIITGQSLYDLKAGYEFVREFKERVDKYDPNLGLVYADDDPEHKGDHLDREFVICPVTSKGETTIFSQYGMAMHMLSAASEHHNYFKETVEDGKRFIAFKDKKVEQVFRMRRADLIAGYAHLLAFEQLFKKLGAIYEADLAHHLTSRLELVRDYIERFNEAVRIGTNTEEVKKSKVGILRNKYQLAFKDPLIIDPTSIEPNMEAVKDHEEKLKQLLAGLY